MTEQTELLPLGIHFGLPQDQYLDDPGLGSTQVKELNIDPLEYWWKSPMGPGVERKESDAMTFGTALHSIVLEGQGAFERLYSVAPRKSDYEGLLVTNDDMKEWLKARGHPTKGTKAVLIDALKEAGCSWPIWEDLIDAHRADCEMRQVESLDAEVAEQLQTRARVIHADPNVKTLLTDGFSEVSIFWEDADGVRWKARVDYIRKQDQTDLKSFQNQFKEPIIKAITKRITSLQGHIQARLHWSGVQAAKDMLLAHGDDAVFRHGKCLSPDEAWLIDFASMPPGPFYWIFAQSTDAPIVRALKCPMSGVRQIRDVDGNVTGTRTEVSEIWNDASLKISYAKKLWLDCKAKFIDGEAWMDLDAQHELNDWDFPPYIIG